MKKNLNISNEELMKLDYKHTHILKKFINDNGKIIPQRVTNMSRSIHTKITKAIKQARFLSLIQFMTKVVVLEKFKKNWEIGSVVSVKDGYARNYLIPNGKAKFATKQNIDEIKLIQGSLLKKDDENKSNASNTASKINEFKLVKEIAAKENGELYGSLSVSDIVAFLSENDVYIQKKAVKLGNKIKTTGEYKVDIDLHPEVNCSLDIEILSPKTSA